MTEPDPCRICDGKVRIRRQPIEQSGSAADARPDMADVRVCTNPGCPKNTGQASMADVV